MPIKDMNQHNDYVYECFEKKSMEELLAYHRDLVAASLERYPDIDKKNVPFWITSSALRLAAGFNDVEFLSNMKKLAQLLADDGYVVGINKPHTPKHSIMLEDLEKVESERVMMNRLVEISHELGEINMDEFSAAAKREGITQAKRLSIWLDRAERINVVMDTVRPGMSGGAGPSGVPILDWQQPLPYDFNQLVLSLSAVGTSRERTPLTSLSEEQLAFYQHFSDATDRGQRVELDGQWEYGFIYVIHLVRRFAGEWKTLRASLQQVIAHYGDTPVGDFAVRTYAETWAANGRFKRYYEELFDARIMEIEEFFASRSLIDRQPSVWHQIQWSRFLQSELVTAGFQDDFEEIANEVQNLMDEASTSGETERDVVLSEIPHYDDNHVRSSSYQNELYVFRQDPQTIRLKKTPHTVYWGGEILGEKARERLKKLFRDAENIVRQKQGIPNIGEGWISETTLFHLIRENFTDHLVVHQGRPAWLGRQSLDIYFPQLNIGVEYQGAQHFQAVSLFGGEEGLRATQLRDQRKRALCAENDCYLLEVMEDYDPHTVLAKLKVVIDERADRVVSEADES